MSAIVVGGGWAGLSAAVTLASHHIPVTLLESAKQLGGRARCVPFNDVSVDNGQHLMVGAYREMLRMLDVIGVAESDVFLRRPLELVMRPPRGEPLRITTRDIPAPFNLIFALAAATGLTVREKVQALRFCLKLAASRFRLKQDISVQALLIHHRQNGRLLNHLWVPLCIATLNTPPHEASAKIFLRVLRDTFAYRREDSDLLIPRHNLCKVFPEPAMQYIESQGGAIRLRHRVTGLRLEHNRVTALALPDGAMDAEHVILATPPAATERLLSPHLALHHIAQPLARMANEPICTVYLRYSPETRLGADMMGLTDGIAQWVFDRGVAGQPGLMAVVISARGPHSRWDQKTLCEKVVDELASVFPRWPAPEDSLVVHEKRATFSSCVEIDRLRPGNKTPVGGLWLAGDYTDTGYPATLEGAIISGIRAAQGIIAERRGLGLAENG